MSIIKSVSVGNGDMFYIKHGTSNFTIIDCNIDETNDISKNNLVTNIQHTDKKFPNSIPAKWMFIRENIRIIERFDIGVGLNLIPSHVDLL